MKYILVTAIRQRNDWVFSSYLGPILFLTRKILLKKNNATIIWKKKKGIIPKEIGRMICSFFINWRFSVKLRFFFFSFKGGGCLDQLWIFYSFFRARGQRPCSFLAKLLLLRFYCVQEKKTRNCFHFLQNKSDSPLLKKEVLFSAGFVLYSSARHHCIIQQLFLTFHFIFVHL